MDFLHPDVSLDTMAALAQVSLMPMSRRSFPPSAWPGERARPISSIPTASTRRGRARLRSGNSWIWLGSEWRSEWLVVTGTWFTWLADFSRNSWGFGILSELSWGISRLFWGSGGIWAKGLTVGSWGQTIFFLFPGDARGIATPRCHRGGVPESKSCGRWGRERMIEMCKGAVDAGFSLKHLFFFLRCSELWMNKLAWDPLSMTWHMWM